MATLSSPPTGAFDRLHKRLAALRRHLRWYYFCHGLNWLIAIGSIAAILVAVFAVLLEAPTPILYGLGALAGLIVLGVFIRFILYPLTRRISDLDLVVLVEREYPWLKDRLISTMQLAQYRGSAEFSPQLAEALAKEVEELVGQQDLREVLKPNRLLPMGVFAVTMSVMLAGTSLALSVYEPVRTTIVVRLIDEEMRDTLGPAERVPPETVLNFIAGREAGASGHRLTVARGSDLVIDGLPNVLGRRSRDLDLEAYAPARLLIDGRDAREMRPRSGERPFYRRVLSDVRRDHTIRIVWRGEESAPIHVEVTEPPRITDSRITYRAPARMRPRQVPKEPGRPDSIPVRIQFDEQDRIEVTIPTIDTLRPGMSLSTIWAEHSEVVVYESEQAFAEADPERYRLYVRERVDETRDEISGTEDMLVSFEFSTNMPIDPDPSKSYLGVRLRPDERDGRELERFPFEPLNEEGTAWRARLRLEQGMRRYFVRLVDERGLHQGALNEFPVNVVPDRPPVARFLDTGVSLLEGRSERFATPEGRFPLVLHAEDDFGLRDLSLEFRKRDEPEDAWRAVPDFDATVELRDFPRELELPFELRISRLLPNLELPEDRQLDLLFRLVAEDVKVDPVHQQGQLGVSPTFELTVISQVRMRAEIRHIIRRVLTQQLEDAVQKQRGLVLATSRFLPGGGDEPQPRSTLEEGIPVGEVFLWEERRADARDRRLTGADALRVQDEISRTSAAVARRLDAIIRHYIYNDLERDRDTPQENRLQEAKILLALTAAEKEAALDLNEMLGEVRDAGDVRAREARMNEALNMLLDPQETGLVNVRARFDVAAFAQTLHSLELFTAGTSREASFQYEQALSPDTPRDARFEALRRALRFQNQTDRVLTEVLTRLGQWEGIDEQVEALRRIRQIQEELRDRVRDEATRD